MVQIANRMPKILKHLKVFLINVTIFIAMYIKWIENDSNREYVSELAETQDSAVKSGYQKIHVKDTNDQNERKNNLASNEADSMAVHFKEVPIFLKMFWKLNPLWFDSIKFNLFERHENGFDSLYCNTSSPLSLHNPYILVSGFSMFIKFKRMSQMWWIAFKLENA